MLELTFLTRAGLSHGKTAAVCSFTSPKQGGGVLLDFTCLTSAGLLHTYKITHYYIFIILTFYLQSYVIYTDVQTA